VNGKEDIMRTKYMMDVYDVMEELGVSKSKAYKVLRELNADLLADGYRFERGKIPRAYWEKKYYGYEQMVV
jgi:predicted transcriptional regulator